MTTEEQPEAEYYTSRGTRGCMVFLVICLMVPCYALVGFGIFKLATKPPAEHTEGIFLLLFGGLPGLFLTVMMFAWMNAGRLRFFADRAELPRAPAPPWCWLGPKRVVYREVIRWGATLFDPDGTGKHLVLVFEISPADGRRHRFLKLGVSYYPDPPAILKEFERRLREPRRVELGGLFGGVSFPD